MNAVFSGTTNISQYIERDSVSILENLNNQRNSCRLSTLQYKMSQASSVYVYASLELTQVAPSGQKVLHVSDTYQDTDKFRAGQIVIVGVNTAHEREYTIDTISHTALTVTLTENLLNSIAVTEVIGYLQFAGVCLAAPEEEIGTTGTFSYNTQLVDWGNLFDREIVVDTYLNQYHREIFGRMIYSDCSNDTEVALEGFEAAWTEGGVGRAMVAEATDRIEGTNAMKTGITGAGTATWTKTISSKNISAQKHVRLFWKIAETYGGLMTGLKLRIGTDASNYFEYTFANIGDAYEDCWNWDSARLANYASKTGTPDLAAVVWLQLVVVGSGSIPAGSIFFDVMLASTGGFTLQNTIRGETKIMKLPCNSIKPTVVVDNVTKKLGLSWYIDYNRDLHVQTIDGAASPMEITDSSMNYSNLKITPDYSRIVNRQTVKGGDAAGSDLFTEIFVADGKQTTFLLAYKPDTLSVYVDTVHDGAHYVQKTIGVENLVVAASYDFIYSFEQKSVRNSALATLAAGDLIKFTYYPYKPIIKRLSDYPSALAMKALTGGKGWYDGAPIIDKTIKTFEDAALRGQAEIDAYKNPIVTATFHTETDGLHPGMLQHIVDSSRGVDDYYLIQTVSAKEKNNGRYTYDVTCGSSLFGIIQFLQWLIKKNITSESSTDELVDIVVNIDEVITFTDAYVFTHKSKIVYAASKLVKNYDFVSEVGSAVATGRIGTADADTGWYAVIGGGEAATLSFDAASNYYTRKALKIVTTIGGTGKSATARLHHRIPVTAGQTISVTAQVAIAAALTNLGTGAGLSLVIKEYASYDGSTVLVTNTITSLLTAAMDFTLKSGSFTLNASTTHISIEFALIAAIGSVSVTEIDISSASAETSTRPGIASFSQAT